MSSSLHTPSTPLSTSSPISQSVDTNTQDTTMTDHLNTTLDEENESMISDSDIEIDTSDETSNDTSETLSSPQDHIVLDIPDLDSQQDPNQQQLKNSMLLDTTDSQEMILKLNEAIHPTMSSSSHTHQVYLNHLKNLHLKSPESVMAFKDNILSSFLQWCSVLAETFSINKFEDTLKQIHPFASEINTTESNHTDTTQPIQSTESTHTNVPISFCQVLEEQKQQLAQKNGLLFSETSYIDLSNQINQWTAQRNKLFAEISKEVTKSKTHKQSDVLLMDSFLTCNKAEFDLLQSLTDLRKKYITRSFESDMLLEQTIVNFLSENMKQIELEYQQVLTTYQQFSQGIRKTISTQEEQNEKQIDQDIKQLTISLMNQWNQDFIPKWNNVFFMFRLSPLEDMELYNFKHQALEPVEHFVHSLVKKDVSSVSGVSDVFSTSAMSTENSENLENSENPDTWFEQYLQIRNVGKLLKNNKLSQLQYMRRNILSVISKLEKKLIQSSDILSMNDPKSIESIQSDQKRLDLLQTKLKTIDQTIASIESQTQEAVNELKRTWWSTLRNNVFKIWIPQVNQYKESTDKLVQLLKELELRNMKMSYAIQEECRSALYSIKQKSILFLLKTLVEKTETYKQENQTQTTDFMKQNQEIQDQLEQLIKVRTQFIRQLSISDGLLTSMALNIQSITHDLFQLKSQYILLFTQQYLVKNIVKLHQILKDDSVLNSLLSC